VAGLVAAALYTDWLILEPVIGTALPPARSYVSELGARSQAHHVIPDALDVVCGLCLLLFCVRLKAVLDADEAPRGARAGTYALMGFAAATTVNALVPMTCAPSVQAGCPAGGLALHAPVEDLAATALSALAVVLSVASMALFAHGLADVAAWRDVSRTGRWLFLAAAPLAVVVGALGSLDVAVGLPQRALIVLQAAWIACLAMGGDAVSRSTRLPRSRPPTRPTPGSAP
jgi:hypothetical protein